MGKYHQKCIKNNIININVGEETKIMAMRRRIAAVVNCAVDKKHNVYGQKNLRRCKCGCEFDAQTYAECPNCSMSRVNG
jgi:hypothetical protein